MVQHDQPGKDPVNLLPLTRDILSHHPLDRPEGIVPVLFAEGSYTTRLETVNEFPKGAVSWIFDKTDMAAAKKILGDRCCLSGNVPTSLMVTGSYKETKEYCRKLIEVCAPGGGFILAGGAHCDQGNPENLRAMMDAAKEFGKY